MIKFNSVFNEILFVFPRSLLCIFHFFISIVISMYISIVDATEMWKFITIESLID